MGRPRLAVGGGCNIPTGRKFNAELKHQGVKKKDNKFCSERKGGGKKRKREDLEGGKRKTRVERKCCSAEVSQSCLQNDCKNDTKQVKIGKLKKYPR